MKEKNKQSKSNDDRAKRLAAQLRTNLRRRKGQSRAIQEASDNTDKFRHNQNTLHACDTNSHEEYENRKESRTPHQ